MLSGTTTEKLIFCAVATHKPFIVCTEPISCSRFDVGVSLITSKSEDEGKDIRAKYG
jgi:hypothetical protein